MTDSANLSYQDAGVDIEKADQLVNQIKGIAKRTHRQGVMQNIGGFGALFEVPTDRFKKPVLVSGTDGVGTKLKLAIDLNCHEHIGIDLVAMCVNDILTLGAEPLFFLDYFATGKLQLEHAQTIIASIGRGCELAGAALIGGETAEMPGLYQADDYDLAGFCVGAVEKDRIIDGSKVAAGDVLIALPSSGLHANGFSLVRKVIDVSKTEIDKSLLTPTRIYVKSVLALCEQIDVHAMSHITGGGLIENIPRTLPDNTVAQIDTSSWQWPAVFSWLQKAGNITTTEMQRTFNVGVGMIIAVSAEDAEESLKILQDKDEDAWIIGKIEPRKDQNEDQVKFS